MPEGSDNRLEPPRQVGERETLENFLDYYRQTILWKVDGMSDQDIRRVIVPSGWSSLGMVKHLAYVERNWFRSRLAGEKGSAGALDRRGPRRGLPDRARRDDRRRPSVLPGRMRAEP